MRSQAIVGVFLVTLWAASVCPGQNMGPAPRMPGSAGIPGQFSGPGGQVMGGGQDYYRGSHQRPPTHMAQPAPGQVESVPSGHPSYPYPPYHNPYYDGTSHNSFVSNILDWVFSVPTSVMDRFADYVDRRFFPAAPATRGQNPNPAVMGGPGQSCAPVQAAPAAPATAYDPDRR